MAPALDAQTWRPSTPDAVEADLAALWRELARDAPVARAVMSNLVVVRDRAAAGGGPGDPASIGADLPIDAVVARHPSRVIVLEHASDPAIERGTLDVSAGIMTFGPDSARYGVELIAVRSTCADASLPSIVRRLVRGDVPTSVWCTGDLSGGPSYDALVTVGRQLVYDSRAWRDVRRGIRTAAALAASDRIGLADLNWRRLTPVRRGLVRAASATGLPARPRPDVRIACRPHEAALAWLLAGWLAARLDLDPRVDEEHAAGPALSVTLSAADFSMRAVVTLDARTLVVQAGTGPTTSAAVAEEATPEALAAELGCLSHDPCLHDSLQALAAWFARGG